MNGGLYKSMKILRGAKDCSARVGIAMAEPIGTPRLGAKGPEKRVRAAEKAYPGTFPRCYKMPVEYLRFSVAITLATLLGAQAAAAAVAGPRNVYRNLAGTRGGAAIAAPIINPGNQGQVVLGAYFDVRGRRLNPASIETAPQITNLQIWNRNTSDEALPECTREDFIAGLDGLHCYNPLGGVLARVFFREAGTSQRALSFPIAIGCGQTWAGSVSMGENNLPQVRTRFPVVKADENGLYIAEVPEEPLPFVRDDNAPGDLEDWHRGFFEIIGIESIPCSATILPGPSGLPDDRIWQWGKLRPGGHEPSNAISAKVFIVQPRSGRSFSYQATALARFVELEGGPIPLGGNLLDTPDQPTLHDCITTGWDKETRLTPAECISAVNLAISSAETLGQFDIQDVFAGQTRIAMAMPTRRYRCLEEFFANSEPFSCHPAGEEVACDLYNRLGNRIENPLEPPPGSDPDLPDPSVCRLPKDMSLVSIRDTVPDPTADLTLWTWELPLGGSGKFTIDLAENDDDELIHQEKYSPRVNSSDQRNLASDHLGPKNLNVQGVPVDGYLGLPVLSVTIQEFTNLSTGGNYGNTTPSGSFQTILLPCD